jgi:hypothetical protein
VLVGSLFSVAALSQPILRQKVVVGRDGRGENVLHWSAGIFPQEQVASLAQTHSAPLFRPQQVMLMLFGWLCERYLVGRIGGGEDVSKLDDRVVEIEIDTAIEKYRPSSFFIHFPSLCRLRRWTLCREVAHQVREHWANQSAADYAVGRASSDFESRSATLMIHEHCEDYHWGDIIWGPFNLMLL